MPDRDKRDEWAGALFETPQAPDAVPRSILLTADALVAFRSDRPVLDGISFAMRAGGALLLRGPNGAGKTTLLRVLAGLCPLASGALRWNGTDIAADPSSHARRVGFLGHTDAIKPGLSVGENLRLAARMSGRPIRPALRAFGLEDMAALPARLLSAGQRRRTALARLVLGDTPLWLLDEPSLGLDTASLDRLGAALATHRAAGGLVVAATHVPLPLDAPAILDLDA